MTELPLDRLLINDLCLRCIVGVYPEERQQPQEVRLSITLELDLRQACRLDELSYSVDYEAFTRRLARRVEGSSFLLIERLAQEIADICLEEEPVQRVRVHLEKPGALPSSTTVAVEILRSRNEPG